MSDIEMEHHHITKSHNDTRNMPPSDSDYRHMAKGAYSGTPVKGYEIVTQSPTIKIYKKPDSDDLVVSARGSYDLRDWKTNVTLPFNGLASSDRYKEDKAFVTNALEKYGKGKKVYVTGHSLGGAVAEQLKKDIPEIKTGKTYNPAFQGSDFFSRKKSNVKRVYGSGDALGVFGRYLPGAEVKKTKKSYANETVSVANPVIGKVADIVRSHQIENISEVPHKKKKRK
jgi:hypothetical protein